MAKIVLLTSVFLFAFGVQGSADLSLLEKSIGDYASKISTTISDAKSELEKYEKKAKAMVSMMETDINKLTASMKSDINAQLTNVDKEWTKIVQNVNSDADIAECRVMKISFEETANATLKNATSCLTNKHTEVRANLAAISSLIESAVSNFTSYSAVALNCGSKVTNLATALRAVTCSAKAFTETAFVVATEVPNLVVKILHLVAQIATLKQSLTACAVTKAIATITNNAILLFTNTNSCIAAIASP